MQFPPGGISPDVNFLSFLSIKRMFIQVVVVLFLLEIKNTSQKLLCEQPSGHQLRFVRFLLERRRRRR
jgi:hypothetical protein